MEDVFEVIQCTCGVNFAACEDGWQDEDWEREKKEYLEFGCRVEKRTRQYIWLSTCNCAKDKTMLNRERAKLGLPSIEETHHNFSNSPQLSLFMNNLKIAFRLSKINKFGNVVLLNNHEYNSYAEAEAAIQTLQAEGEVGLFQVQKVYFLNQE